VNPIETLGRLLRPAGGGIHLVSTGRAEQLDLQERLYGVSGEAAVAEAWRADLARLGSARALLLGIPSDVGAGFQRGANLGPSAVRARLLADDPGFPARARAAGVVDLGDVFVVPQLLHDEMLAPAQLAASRRALYPDLAPGAKVLALGGDHSAAWPVVKALAAARPGLGIVQVDAHTDLLEERLGVRYCFGTWSFHANDLLGRGGRLVQVGTRASRHERAHWESKLDVRQFWAAEVNRDPGGALDAIAGAVRRSGARSVYFSNDIDGTDEAFADATGTPEPGGLSPEFVEALVRRLGGEVELAGGDVMEVAPAIARTPGGRERTLATAVRYLRTTAGAILGSPP
jgi:agmatinase